MTPLKFTPDQQNLLDLPPCVNDDYIMVNRDQYINTMMVLRTLFAIAKLDAGVRKTDELIKAAKEWHQQ